jgi:hypothetical protein
MDTIQILRDLFIIIVIAKLFGLIARRLHAPQVAGEIIAGLLIGPTLLNLVNPSDFLSDMAEIGVILLMFSAGLETDIDKLKKMYPEVSAMIDANQIIVKQDEDASAAVKADEKREVEELKSYAKAHGINVGRANKKESLLAANKKAEKEAEEKAEQSDD